MYFLACCNPVAKVCGFEAALHRPYTQGRAFLNTSGTSTAEFAIILAKPTSLPPMLSRTALIFFGIRAAHGGIVAALLLKSSSFRFPCVHSVLANAAGFLQKSLSAFTIWGASSKNESLTSSRAHHAFRMPWYTSAPVQE